MDINLSSLDNDMQNEVRYFKEQGNLKYRKGIEKLINLYDTVKNDRIYLNAATKKYVRELRNINKIYREVDSSFENGDIDNLLLLSKANVTVSDTIDADSFMIMHRTNLSSFINKHYNDIESIIANFYTTFEQNDYFEYINGYIKNIEKKDLLYSIFMAIKELNS